MGSNMAIKVTRKDQSEANENIIRRFNRKVLQSGMMPLAKSQMRFSKPISKTERRKKAIVREERKAEKAERIKLGLK
ncbi:30S ribosomal protein S21 [Candidatus Saccharibacteria bacterium]|nr:30S ribosomal protein S21 [Candidatus Saccharibacteria bacterium]